MSRFISFRNGTSLLLRKGYLDRLSGDVGWVLWAFLTFLNRHSVKGLQKIYKRSEENLEDFGALCIEPGRHFSPIY